MGQVRVSGFESHGLSGETHLTPMFMGNTSLEAPMRHHHPSHRMRSKDERGAGLVEYAMLMALIAIVVFSAVSFFGSSAGAGFGHSKNCIEMAYNDTLGGGGCPKNTGP